jgi:hypothetical protein
MNTSIESLFAFETGLIGLGLLSSFLGAHAIKLKELITFLFRVSLNDRILLGNELFGFYCGRDITIYTGRPRFLVPGA